MANTVLYTPSNEHRASLFLFDRNGFLSSHELNIAQTIGSDPKASDIIINSPLTSPIHGKIFFSDGKYYYKDNESRNGTFLNRTLLGVNSPGNVFSAPLSDGDVLFFDAPQNGEHNRDCVFAIFSTTLPTNTEWSSCDASDKVSKVNIGRLKSSDLIIRNAVISEQHASLILTENGWAIIDHNSTNGVFLNQKKLSSPRYLNTLDTIRIANVFFVFLGDCFLISLSQPNKEDCVARKDEDNLVISIVERSTTRMFKRITLLKDINISVADGEMVLILGGSGAGKTTFMNAVMGYEKASGRITYNNTDIYEDYDSMKYEIGFVPQQDLLRGGDTVYSTLSNAAELKLSKEINFEDRATRIENTLGELGLSRERNSLVSKLSGGQRKRLSIAVELISNPKLFFLDEPDSGLDDVMGRSLMEILRNISDSGKIVMVITHSPERAADLFDKVVVLAKSSEDNCGHLAFFGSPDEAFAFFDAKSFREIVKKINRSDEGGDGLSDFYIDKYNNFLRGTNYE